MKTDIEWIRPAAPVFPAGPDPPGSLRFLLRQVSRPEPNQIDIHHALRVRLRHRADRPACELRIDNRSRFRNHLFLIVDKDADFAAFAFQPDFIPNVHSQFQVRRKILDHVRMEPNVRNVAARFQDRIVFIKRV